MNPWVTKFFNLTAGLEKFVIAVLAAFGTWVGAYGYFVANWDPATIILVQALLGAVQVLYTESTTRKPVPPTNPTVEEIHTIPGASEK